jgi:hypothetical protein
MGGEIDREAADRTLQVARRYALARGAYGALRIGREIDALARAVGIEDDLAIGIRRRIGAQDREC